MLAPSVMTVLIMLDEKINPGRKLTAEEILKRKSRMKSIKVPQ